MPASQPVKSVPGHMLLREFLEMIIQTELQRVAGLTQKETDVGKGPDQSAFWAKDILMSQERSTLHLRAKSSLTSSEQSSITCPDLAGSHNLPLYLGVSNLYLQHIRRS